MCNAQITSLVNAAIATAADPLLIGLATILLKYVGLYSAPRATI
jgi:hypothetical protein